MYCPNCSSEASTDQKFCRLCGMELQPVAALIRGQSPMVKLQSHQEQSLEGKHRTMVFWGFLMMFGAVAVGVCLKLLGREGIRPFAGFTPYVNVIAVLTALFSMGLICYPFLQMVSGNTRSRRRLLPQSDPTVKLAPALLPTEQPSVIEKTTEFLEGHEAPIKVHDTTPQNS